jgi:hypothetical protein
LLAPPAIDGDAREWKGVATMPIVAPGAPSRTTARLAYDNDNLYALFEVEDPTPWRNEGKDATRLFKTGDAVDLQLAARPEPDAARKRRDVNDGDLRVVFAQLGGRPVAVLMRPIDPAAAKDKQVRYHSPVMDKVFDRVEVLAEATVAVKVQGSRYTLEAAIPLKALGLPARSGLVLRGDAGVIASDAQGLTNTARTYWSNPHANLVSDLPSEAWLAPEGWGKLTLE